MITVKDIRRAIKGLKDDAKVCLMVLNDPDPFVDVEFVAARTIGGHLVIDAEIDPEEKEDDSEHDLGQCEACGLRRAVHEIIDPVDPKYDQMLCDECNENAD